MEVKKRNVLVIGETGVGKSSVVNLIVGDIVAKASNSAERGTFSIEKFSYDDFILFDTIGYNDEAEKNPTEALTNLAKFGMNIHSEGISLIIYIMKKGRRTAISKRNFDYFGKNVCQDQVPVLLVVTHCEDENPRKNWYSTQKESFQNSGMIFADAVCGCTIDLSNPDLDPDMLPIYNRKRKDTQDSIRQNINELALLPSWAPTNWYDWLIKLLQDAVNNLEISASTLCAFIPMLSLVLEKPGPDIVKQIEKIYGLTHMDSNEIN